MHALSVKDLSVSFDGNNVLRDVSFDIPKGEIAAIIGPNGSGKTTLFRAILDLIPYAGNVKIFGKPAGQEMHRVGYVPQIMEFDRTLPITVKEFLTLMAKSAHDMDSNICKEVRIELLLGKLIGELSGGQLQRVLIAAALMKKPDILFLDEASAGIDIECTRLFHELIDHLKREHGTTILMISHEIEMVYHIADTVICLNRDLVCNGPPRTALTKDVMQQLYGEEVKHRPHEHI
jgi:ABC-type Mn2+/Zn2+ transport system ATPase subunit